MSMLPTIYSLGLSLRKMSKSVGPGIKVEARIRDFSHPNLSLPAEAMSGVNSALVP